MLAKNTKKKKKEQKRNAKITAAAEEREVDSTLASRLGMAIHHSLLVPDLTPVGPEDFDRLLSRLKQLDRAGKSSAVLKLVQPWIESNSVQSGAKIITKFTAQLSTAFASSAISFFKLDSFLEAQTAAADGLCVLSAMQDAYKNQNIPHPNPIKNNFDKAQLLHVRGMATKQLKDLEGAYLDLRAACLLRPFDECLMDLLGIMALQKLGQPRPHYTKKERVSFNKELRLDNYAPKRYVCALPGCQADSAEAKLKLCSRCENTWYCNLDHQKQDWKRHKQMLCQPVRITVVFAEDRLKILQAVQKEGFCIVNTEKTGSCAIVRDDEGKLHASLGDRDVVFVAKEQARRIMHEWKQLSESN